MYMVYMQIGGILILAVIVSSKITPRHWIAVHVHVHTCTDMLEQVCTCVHVLESITISINLLAHDMHKHANIAGGCTHGTCLGSHQEWRC